MIIKGWHLNIFFLVKRLHADHNIDSVAMNLHTVQESQWHFF